MLIRDSHSYLGMENLHIWEGRNFLYAVLKINISFCLIMSENWDFFVIFIIFVIQKVKKLPTEVLNLKSIFKYC